MTKIAIEDNKIFKPTFRGVFTLTISALLFGGLSYVFWITSKVSDSLSSRIITYCIQGLFIIFFLMSIHYILKIKIIALTSDRLVIKYPLKLKNVDILYSDISTTDIVPQIVKTSTRTGIMTVYEGKRILLRLSDNIQIEIDSFQTQNFELLCLILGKRIKKLSS